nr:MAG TPA: hypothetical protein [Caudoviricetes sp.]
MKRVKHVFNMVWTWGCSSIPMPRNMRTKM